MIVGQMIKEPHEEIAVAIDYRNELVAAEIILAADVTSKNAATLADTSSSFLTAAAVEIASPVVTKRCHAGAHGETHIVQIAATTSFGNVYEHEVEVMVAES